MVTEICEFIIVVNQNIQFQVASQMGKHLFYMIETACSSLVFIGRKWLSHKRRERRRRPLMILVFVFLFIVWDGSIDVFVSSSGIE